MASFDAYKSLIVGSYYQVKSQAKQIMTRFFRNRGDDRAYESAEDNRFTKQWYPSLDTPDREIVFDLETLRARSRDLYRNSHIGAAIIDTLTDNVIGTGLKFQSSIDRDVLGLSDEEADAWEDNVERRFRMWCETREADAQRKKNFYGIQELAYKSWKKSGDVFATLPLIARQGSPFDLRVQLIEADKCSDPFGSGHIFNRDSMRGGVEVGQHGEPIRYWFKQSDGSFKPVLAYGLKSGRVNVVHLFKEDRPDQNRGVPIMAKIMTKVKQLKRYDEAELTAAVVSAFFTIFIKSNDAGTIKSQASELLDERSRGDEYPNQDEFDYALGAGMINRLTEGEDVVGFNPLRPNSSHAPFSDIMLRNIGMGVNIPFEILVKRFDSSYSASRASRLEFWKFILKEREYMSLMFNQPIFEEWLWAEVLRGAIQAPGFLTDRNMRAAWCRATWVGQAMGQIDPVKETNAAILQINNGLSTRKRETMSINGGDFRSNARQLAKENKKLAETTQPEANGVEQ